MRLVPGLLVGFVVLACGGDDEPDAYGNFETTEVVVSAEIGGRLLWFTADEGSRLRPDSVVGVIDTTELALELAQLVAQQASSGSRAAEVTKQRAALETEREIAERIYQRTQRLHAEKAATAQQLDQAEREYRVLGEQIEATRAQHRSVRQDVAGAEARVAQIQERLRKSRISSPLGGTVLATYAEPGEFVQTGQPLYKMANLDSMVLRAYVTEPQLAQVRLGQQARVSIDVGGDDRRVLPGTVTWLSSEAEFTPTPIQTREERADLVYALKIQVPNPEGQVKIGMPADVEFVSGNAGSASAP